MTVLVRSRGCLAWRLFGAFVFEEGAGGGEVEGLAIDDEDPVAGVFGDGFDVLDGVAFGAKLLSDETGIYHGVNLQDGADEMARGVGRCDPSRRTTRGVLAGLEVR